MTAFALMVGWTVIITAIIYSLCRFVNFCRRVCFGLMLGWSWRQERKRLIAQGLVTEKEYDSRTLKGKAA